MAPKRKRKDEGLLSRLPAEQAEEEWLVEEDSEEAKRRSLAAPDAAPDAAPGVYSHLLKQGNNPG